MVTGSITKYKGKKVLVTGNTGFKGSWLTIALLEAGADVYGYALPPKTTRDNFVTTRLDKKISQVYGDIRDRQLLFSAIENIKPEIIFHMAAQPLVVESYLNPVETFEVNMMGTVNVLEAARTFDFIQLVINVTTDKCYDNKEWIWGYKETDAMGGKDPYSASKGCSELITSSYIHSYFQDKGCLVASGRAGNVIGGGDWAENRIIPDFFRAFETGSTLEMRSPHATRPWQFVLEPVFGYIKLGAELLDKGKELQGGWNFGPASSSHKTVGELINSINRYSESKPVAVAYTESQYHEAHYLKLDITKASMLLHWHPVLNFEQTVEFTVKGYMDEIASESDLYEKRVKQLKAYMALDK